jgi:large subunit ribosomal protein L21
MYAVILSGGKQYRVEQGQTLKLESLPGEVGSSIHFDQVLMIGEGSDITVGKPYVTGCKVMADIISHGRHSKIHIIKFRRRKHHEKWQGHRQNYTEVEIKEIIA